MKKIIFFSFLLSGFVSITNTLQAQVEEEEVAEEMIEIDAPVIDITPPSVEAKPKQRVAPKRAHRGKVSGRYGFYSGNEWLVPPDYDDLPKEYSDFMIAKKNDKYGVIDRLNNIILPFEYERFIRIYKDYENWRDKEWMGYYSIEKNGVKGMIDRNGKVMIPVEHETISKIKEGVFCVGSKGSGYGIMTVEGKVLLPLEYEEVLSNRNDKYLQTKKDGKYGWIDMEGKIILAFEYDEIEHFNYPTTHWMFNKNGKWGLMDNDFKVIIKPTYDYMRKRNQYLNVIKDGKNGFYNASFKEIIPTEYKEISFLTRKLLLVRRDAHDSKGVYDSTGVQVIPEEFRYVTAVNDNLIFAAKTWAPHAMFDGKGKQIKPPTYFAPRVRNPYIITSKEREGKLGLLNDKGEEITEFIYDKLEVNNRSRNRPVTITAERDGLKGNLNLDGTEGKNFQPKGEDPAITYAREEKKRNDAILKQLQGEWYGLQNVNNQEHLINVSFLSPDMGIRTIYYLESGKVCFLEQYFLPKLLGSMGGGRTLVGQLQTRDVMTKCDAPNMNFNNLKTKVIFNQMLSVKSIGFGRNQGYTLDDYFKKESPVHVADDYVTLLKIKDLLKLANELSKKVESRPGGLRQYPEFHIAASTGNLSLKRDKEEVFGKIAKEGEQYVFQTEHWMDDHNYSLAGIFRNITYKDANGNIKTGDLDICFMATRKQKFWFRELKD